MKNLKQAIYKMFDRILYALEMFPTKNQNGSNWLYEHKIKSSAYPDGTHYEYLNGAHISEVKRNKVNYNG